MLSISTMTTWMVDEAQTLAFSRLASSKVTADRASVTMKQHTAPSAPRSSCFSCRIVTPPRPSGALVLARGWVPSDSLLPIAARGSRLEHRCCQVKQAKHRQQAPGPLRNKGVSSSVKEGRSAPEVVALRLQHG